MRVLFNTYPVAFDCPGGGEIQLLRSRAALMRAGLHVPLFDPWQPQLDGCDLVHYFSVQGGSMNFCAHVKRRGLPLIISPILWLTEQNRPHLPMGEIRDLLHLCDRVLPNSRAERDQLIDAFGLDPGKIVVTPNGVDDSFLEASDPELFRDHFDVPGPYVLNVANVEPRKNQLRLIQAMAGLDIELVLLGHIRDPQYWETCRQAARGRLRHLGHVPHGSDLLRSAYRGCTLFALPSLLETPGLSALEAGAQGAPLLLTSVGAAPEYFGGLATYVDPLDVDSIRSGLIQAIARPAAVDLPAHIATHFTWDRVAAALVSAYRSCRRCAA